MSKDTLEEFWDLIESFDICMVTSRDRNLLRSRPMASHAMREKNQIAFLTSSDAHKNSELEKDPNVNLSFSKPGSNDYVSVSGKAVISNDGELINEMWGPFAKAWFPEGPDSDEVMAIVVTPEQGEYWEGDSNRLKIGWELIKAYTGGKKPDMGDNRKVAF